jgi:GT2 family glycosyltransferase
MSKVAIILINYKDYAKKYLPECIESLRKQDYPKDDFKIFIVDNATSSETIQYLKDTASEAEVIPNEANAGFAEGNNIAMRKILDSGYDYVVLFNMDTIASPTWLSELVKKAEENRGAGAIQSLILLHPETDKINSSGNLLHFLGFGFCRDYGTEFLKFNPLKIEPFFYVSGASVLFPTKVLKEVGIFDPEFFMYHEDTDLSWKIRLAGYDILLAEKSIMYHKYQFSRSVLQFYYMERNRMIMLFENFKLGTLLLLAPPFLIMEMGLLGYALLRGLAGGKIKVYWYFLQLKNWTRMMKNKKEKLKLRKVSDREIAKLMVGKIDFQEIANPILKYLVNPIFDIYWKVVRNFIFW